MWCYAVLSEKENKLPDLLADVLKTYGFDVLRINSSSKGKMRPATDKTIAVVAEDEENSLRALKPHIVIVPPSADLEKYTFRKAISCHAAVLPGSTSPGISGRIEGKYLVTYGMSPRDTITLSSTGDTCMLAIQREIIDLNGVKTDIQEVPLAMKAENPDHIMAAAAVALLSGMQAGRLCERL
jgi:hypothetical protein